jgi:carboxyl-terminal processing protease
LLAPRWTLTLVLVGACGFYLRAAADSDKLRDLKLQAESLERQGEWDKACDVYEALLRLRRDLPDVKERYIHCVRRLWQSRRHHDLSYRKEVLSIEYGQAIHLYNVVRDLLLDQSLDRKKLTPTRLFRKGLEEFDHALADPFFRDQHISADRLDKVGEFRTLMLKTWGEVSPASRKQAREQVCEIALAAQNYLGLNATVVIMEFTCGACYSLDEYTVYLTPSQLRDLCSSLRGAMVGVGITLAMQDGKLVILQVEMGSPAARQSLMPSDQVLSIDKKPVSSLAVEAVAGLLEGQAGSMVELEILSPKIGMRSVLLRREAVAVPSVAARMLSDGSTAELKITAFQENTLKEVDDAIAALAASGMKALVIDLRGNGGGVFESAVEVARRFLAGGVIATKQHLDEKSNVVTTHCEAKNPNALTLPLAVLIDNDTASSAEVLAGALKENNRAILVGQPTYGKGCTQYLLKLPDFKGGLPAGGMRLTVAKVFSPKGLPYTGRGVLPDIVVDRDSMMYDATLATAQAEVQRVLSMGPR